MDILKTALVVLLCALVVDYQGVWADVYRYVMWFMVGITVIKSCVLLSLHYTGKMSSDYRKSLRNDVDIVIYLCAGLLLAAHTTTMSIIGAKWLGITYLITFTLSWAVWLMATFKVFKG